MQISPYMDVVPLVDNGEYTTPLRSGQRLLLPDDRSTIELGASTPVHCIFTGHVLERTKIDVSCPSELETSLVLQLLVEVLGFLEADTSLLTQRLDALHLVGAIRSDTNVEADKGGGFGNGIQCSDGADGIAVAELPHTHVADEHEEGVGLVGIDVHGGSVVLLC